MRIFRIAARRFHSLFHHSLAESELNREIEFHLDQLTKENIAAGMSERDGRLAARRAFGSPEVAKEHCRDMRRVRLMEDLARDLAHALRLLKKSPAFTATAVLSIALGIGANTVVFSVLNALVLRPLPVAEPERLFFVNRSGMPSNSFPNYRDVRDRNHVFESLFAYRITPVALDQTFGATRVWGYLVTGNYFQTLGIQPALGRFFTPAEDRVPNASPYVVLSYACWRNRFAGDPGVIGGAVRINGLPYTVLGVAPRGFHGTEVFYWAEVWIPMMMQARVESNPWLEERNTFNAWIAGRLKPGVTVEQAEANLQTIAAQLAREHAVNEGMRLTLSPPGLAGAAGREPARAFVAGLMLLATLVLLAACANLATLLAARAADRERELAIRVSIGAGRGRVMKQLLTESLALSVIGGAAGCGLAIALLRALSQWRAPLDFPVQFDVLPDWRVFVLCSAITLITGLLFGAAPARRAWNSEPAMSFKGLAAPVSTHRLAARDILLPVQIALCSVLVISSLVAVRGLARSFATPLGFRPDGAAVIGFDLGLAGYDETRGRRFGQRVLEEADRLPGVESVAISSCVPLSIDQSTTTLYRQDATDFRPNHAIEAIYYYVSPGYFRTAGARLIAGRAFTFYDNEAAPRVAIVNQTLARRLFGTEDAIGRMFLLGRRLPVQIAGVAEDGKYETLTETPKSVVFFPILQSYSPAIVLMARTHRPEIELAAEMRQMMARLNPGIAVYGVGSLRQMLGLVYLPMHAAAITLGAFGVLSLMLAVTGIYGLSTYTVSRRSREIGIRMALGAQRGTVLRFVFGRMGALVAAGAAAGLGLGVAAAGVMAGIVYRASPRDPMVIAGAVASIAVVAIIAGFGPARRATRVDPVQVLRHE
jgi:predicted permease